MPRPALLILLTAAFSAGCGNVITTETNGASAMSLSRSGTLQLNLIVCSGSVGSLSLYGPHRGSESTPQKPLGSWLAKDPVTADALIDLDDPGPAWTMQRDPGRLQPAVVYSVLAGSRTEDEELSQVDFSLDRLQSAPAGTVLYHDAEVVTADSLRATVCD